LNPAAVRPISGRHPGPGHRAKTGRHENTRQTIEIAAGDVAAALHRLGIGSDETVTVTIERERELIPGRRESRARVAASNLTDDDIDRLIKQARREVEPPPG